MTGMRIPCLIVFSCCFKNMNSKGLLKKKKEHGGNNTLWLQQKTATYKRGRHSE